jgi:hypothetical protein
VTYYEYIWYLEYTFSTLRLFEDYSEVIGVPEDLDQDTKQCYHDVGRFLMELVCEEIDKVCAFAFALVRVSRRVDFLDLETLKDD